MQARFVLALLVAALLHAVPAALSLRRAVRGIIDIPPVKDKKAIIFKGDSKRIQENGVFCICSPSKRGYRDDIRAFLVKGLEEVQAARTAAKNAGNTAIDISRASAEISAGIGGQCIALNNSSWEDCVNADASLRKDFEFQYCIYDKKTWKNVYRFTKGSEFEFKTVGPCDQSPRGRSAFVGKLTYRKSASKNEGCVAVEHLHGYVLQHPRHLLRPVLCAGGFCATPNHAILVRGELTSMNRMCSSGRWKCVESVKMVNNLKISANRRARVSDDIVVTPYDIRFPKALCWVAQVLEDVWYVVSTSVLLGFFSIAVALLGRKFASHLPSAL